MPRLCSIEFASSGLVFPLCSAKGLPSCTPIRDPPELPIQGDDNPRDGIGRCCKTTTGVGLMRNARRGTPRPSTGLQGSCRLGPVSRRPRCVLSPSFSSLLSFNFLIIVYIDALT